MLNCNNFRRSLFFNQYFSSFILGVISALAFAPTYFIPLALFGFTGLFLLFDKQKSSKKTFFLGWSFGFGHFMVGFYWISISLFVDISQFFWLLPFSISLIPAFLAIYIGLAVVFTNKISKRFKLKKLERIILFAILWIFCEYLRATLFTGFPWNLLGYSLAFSTNISQIASITGIYGLSLLAILLYTLPAILFEKIKDNSAHKNSTKLNEWLGLKLDDNSKKNFYFILSFLLLIVGISTYGQNRISQEKLTLVKNGNIRIIQPNIKQTYKWDPTYKQESFLKHIKMSLRDDNKNINYVILSESSIPYLIDSNSVELLEVLKLAIPENAFLISGGLRRGINKYGKNGYFNSIFTFNKKGEIVNFYDKRHLVPFGEYIPFQKYLPFLSKITHGAEGFSSGNEAETIFVQKDFPSFKPLICYEIIFSNLIKSDIRPDFLVNLTNDAWFGTSSGPYQHLTMSRIRAIEYGLPLVRVANTGISAFIDPYGRIIQEIPLNQEDVIDIKLIEKLKPTIYDRYGTKTLFAIIILILLPLILGRIYNVFQTKPNRQAYRK